MRTYYRGNDALVTDVLFIRRTAPPQSFAIRDLQDVGIVRGGSGPLGPGAACAIAGALTVVATGWLALGGPPVLVATLFGLAACALVAVAYGRARSAEWELRATYRHTGVVLYASSDSRVFNQVTRALQRSLEDAATPSSWYDLAAG